MLIVTIVLRILYVLRVPPASAEATICLEIFLVVLMAFEIWAAIDAALCARRTREALLTRYNSFWVYFAMVAATTIVNAAGGPVAGNWLSFSQPSASMEPTLLVGDWYFTWGRYYDNHPPQRGDVVVFKLPSDPSVYYVKRVIGLPGDRVQMIHGDLKINAETVKRMPIEDFVERDPWGKTRRIAQYRETLPAGTTYSIIRYPNSDGSPLNNTQEFLVPPNHFFVMGDNRDNSLDSRVAAMGNRPAPVGYVPAENLIGRSGIIYLSFDNIAPWELWRWSTGIRWSRLYSSII
jgi:signal peptidase I